MKAHSKFGGGVRLNLLRAPKNDLIFTWYVHGVPSKGHRFYHGKAVYIVEDVNWRAADTIDVIARKAGDVIEG